MTSSMMLDDSSQHTGHKVEEIVSCSLYSPRRNLTYNTRSTLSRLSFSEVSFAGYLRVLSAAPDFPKCANDRQKDSRPAALQMDFDNSDASEAFREQRIALLNLCVSRKLFLFEIIYYRSKEAVSTNQAELIFLARSPTGSAVNGDNQYQFENESGRL